MHTKVIFEKFESTKAVVLSFLFLFFLMVGGLIKNTRNL